jgi:hypothetical protein
MPTDNHCHLLNFKRVKTQQMQNSAIYVSITMHIINNLVELFISVFPLAGTIHTKHFIVSSLNLYCLFPTKLTEKVNLHTEIRSKVQSSSKYRVNKWKSCQLNVHGGNGWCDCYTCLKNIPSKQILALFLHPINGKLGWIL